MGWSIGYDDKWKRDIGYGVPALCDHPDCDKEIDRGLGYVCGGEPFGGYRGCGLFFCGHHLLYSERLPVLCERCKDRKKPFIPKPDIKYWMRWKMKHPSWKEWRDENPDEVLKIRTILYPKQVAEEMNHDR